MKKIDQLQFISKETAEFNHLQVIDRACEAGVKWVQLRVKDKPVSEVDSIAEQARHICDIYHAKLIINDYPEIALKYKADGVHLGKEDMPIKEARKLLGNDMIIGGTANTFEDVQKLYEDGVDYVGLGPFGHTTTKLKLSPMLGLEGYKPIIKECKEKNVDVPIIAIGGIELENIKDIIKTGVYGIAVSSLIAYAKEFKQVIEDIQYQLKKAKENA